MAKFETIKLDDVLYDCHRVRMGNTTMRRMATFTVRVLEIDPKARQALVSWNGNRPCWYSERSLARLRRTPVKPRPSLACQPAARKGE